MEKDKTLMYLEKVELNEDSFHRPFFTIEENEGVVMLAKQDDNFILIEQYRRPVESLVKQLPGGGVKKGEALEQAVRREFFEETGFHCGRSIFL